MGEDSERRKEDGEDGSGTRGGRERESGRRGDDLERTEEELEDGNGTWRGWTRDFEKGETRLSRGRKQDF